MKTYELLVIGAGASGMMAAISAAENGIPGSEILVLERNEKPGKKLYITGKGRCNLTNACDIEELFLNVPRNNKFLYSAFYGFSNAQTIDFFEAAGLKTKVERGDRVFPVSDHASDVIATLKRLMANHGIEVYYHSFVKKIERRLNGEFLITLSDNKTYLTKRLLLATGGKSYQSTGSDGNGYVLAQSLGHAITSLRPSLVPMHAKEEDIKTLQGLSPKNVRIKITDISDGKVLYDQFGEMLFTHFGVSGPLILSASAVVGDRLIKEPLLLHIDWKSALSIEQLDARLLREFEENKKKQLKNAVQGLVPAKLLPVWLQRSGISENARISELTRAERERLIFCLKDFTVTLTGLRGFEEAIITRGGIQVKEINPSTMESKLVPGLYFAGELLDLDAFTGGFNLQIAWSTGYLAGLCAAGAYLDCLKGSKA